LAVSLCVLCYGTQDFDEFRRIFGKIYTAEEEVERRRIFNTNVKYINDFNAKGTATYTLGVNQFADMTNEEYREKMLMKKRTVTHKKHPFKLSPSTEGLPSTVDWRQKGAVTPVKNQGQCGSCWSFSTTGTIEGINQIKTGNLVSLSEKNLMDCSYLEGNMACNGGIPTSAMTYVILNGGIDTEESYPYSPESSDTCSYDASNKGASINLYVTVLWFDESALQTATAQQPVSVCIDASHNSFQFYQSGVYYEPNCSEFSLDHAVLSIGYGTYNGTDYWLVKNSWGTTWGLNGYIMMARNQGNNCGIATDASYPVIF